MKNLGINLLTAAAILLILSIPVIIYGGLAYVIIHFVHKLW